MRLTVGNASSMEKILASMLFGRILIVQTCVSWLETQIGKLDKLISSNNRSHSHRNPILNDPTMPSHTPSIWQLITWIWMVTKPKIIKCTFTSTTNKRMWLQLQFHLSCWTSFEADKNWTGDIHRQQQCPNTPMLAVSSKWFLHMMFWLVKTCTFIFGSIHLWNFSFLRQIWGQASQMQSAL